MGILWEVEAPITTVTRNKTSERKIQATGINSGEIKMGYKCSTNLFKEKTEREVQFPPKT